MALTFVASAVGANGSGTPVSTADTTTALNVAAGDVLVTWTKHEGAPTTIAVADTGGGNAHTFDAGDKVDHSNGDLSASFGYVLSAAADASFTGRITLGAARPYVTVIVFQFRPDSGETVTKDASNTGQGNGTAVASGAITTTGDDEIVLGGYGEYFASNSSAHQINGVNATGVVQSSAGSGNFTAAWYRILSATFAGGTATCTAGGSSDWIGNIISFKSAAGGGTAPTAQYINVSPLFILGMG